MISSELNFYYKKMFFEDEYSIHDFTIFKKYFNKYGLFPGEYNNHSQINVLKLKEELIGILEEKISFYNWLDINQLISSIIADKFFKEKVNFSFNKKNNNYEDYIVQQSLINTQIKIFIIF